jgi:YD repeat-containing protein
MGRIVSARNTSAYVARTYFANGLLQTETDSVATYTGSDFTKHIYDLAYQYDLNGRRTQFTLPANLTTSPVQGTKNTTSYTYNPGSSLLETVTDPLGNVFTYGYDGASQLTGLTMPGGISQAWNYDEAGRVVRDSVHNASTSTHKFTPTRLRNVTLDYDARGKAMHEWNGAGKKDSLTASYSGLGYLVRSLYSDSSNALLSPGSISRYFADEQFTYDGLGNLVGDGLTYSGRGNDPAFSYPGAKQRTYEHLTGRLAEVIAAAQRRDTMVYDSAGNIQFSTSSPAVGAPSDQHLEDRASYFDAADRLTAVDHRWAERTFFSGGGASQWPIRYEFDNYRYDALGRRILVRGGPAIRSISIRMIVH